MRKIKLGEVLDVKRGASISGEYYATEGDLIRLTLGNFNYPGGGFKPNTSKDDIYYVGPVRDEFIMKKGDIITPLTEQVRGLLGETAIIPESGKYVQNGDIGKIIPNEKVLDKSFAAYLISSPVIKAQLDAAAQQTKIRHTSPDKIKDCIAWIPTINEQKKIGKVVDDINEKIKTNNRINSELETMAKTIYDYWFLQFEFPNEEGKPYKSSGGKMVWNDELKREIPEGWEVRKYCEVSTTVTGKEDANFATVNGKYAYFTCGSDVLKCDEFKFDGKAILIAGNGDFNVKYYNGQFNAYQRTYVLMPDEKYIGILYQASLRKINQFKSGSNGSIVKFITKGDVDGIELIIPNKEGILELFNIILDAIQHNNRQNQELASLRDFLLPMLMNGQVTFKDEDI